MQFSSKPPFNDDPEPWTDNFTGDRTSQRTGYMASTFSSWPRPEYERPQHNPTNPILAEFRKFCAPDEWDIVGDSARIALYADSWVDLMAEYPNDDRTAWGSLADLPRQNFDHARRVLTRLANLNKEN